MNVISVDVANETRGGTLWMSETKSERKCPCTYDDCERHANCKACQAYHHGLGQKTCCERLKK